MSKEVIAAKWSGILRERTQRIGYEVRDTQKILVNEPYPPASSPGNPPHRRTGNLRDHILCSEVEQTGTMLSVTNFIPPEIVPYAYELEYGTRPYVAARPFFVVGIEAVKPYMGAILAGYG